MSLPDSLIISQLRLVRGVRQDETPTIGIFEPRSVLRRQESGTLFVLIDLLAETQDDDALLRGLMETTRRAYEQETGSITRRLRHAIVAANQFLWDWNRERTDGRQAAGITCAVLVGEEVYLAQAGPALAIVAQPGMVDRFPENSPWLSEEPLESIPGGIWTPLGLNREVYADLNFTRIGPGYNLCLVSAHLPQLLTEEEIAEILDQEPEDVTRDLAVIASGQNLSAVVVGLVEPESVEIPPAVEPAPEPRGPGLGARIGKGMRRGAIAIGSMVVTMLGGITKILEGLLPERIGAGASERRRQALMWLAILIPAALTVLTVAMYWGRRGDEETRFLGLVQSASSQVEQAQALSETNPGQARQLLQAASQELDQALRIRPGDAAAQRLRAEVVAQLEAVEGIVRLTELNVVASLPGDARERRRLILQGTSAFVLNVSEQVVYRVGLGNRRIIQVLKSDDLYGDQLVGPLVDMTWVPPGGVRGLGAVVALDSTGTAWQIDAAGVVTPLKVAGAENWRGLRLLGGFAGNLYVLDVGLGQILKYSPTADGYALPPVDWLAPDAAVNLEDAVDMAIDGAIYLLRSSGRVEKLVAGKPVPFDQPDEFDLTEPIACFTAPPAGRVFLADTTRILEFDDAGIFQRQLLPPEGNWQRLSALWVDRVNGWLYAVDAGRLVMAALP